MRAFAFGILIYKAFSQKSVAGLSLKTIQCYVFVYFFRLCSILRYQGYLPFDRSGDWLYSTLEISAFLMAIACVYLIMFQFKSSYDIQKDVFGNLHVPSEFGIVYILVPCSLLAMVGVLVLFCSFYIWIE